MALVAPQTLRRLIGVCPARGCATVRALGTDPEAARQGDLFGDGALVTVTPPPVRPRCPRHGPLRWHAVIGRLSPGRRCDIRCRAATGPDCACCCAGRAHGSAWDGAGDGTAPLSPAVPVAAALSALTAVRSSG